MLLRRTQGLVVGAALCAAAVACRPRVATEDVGSRPLRAALEGPSPAYIARAGDGRRLWKDLRTFYAQRHYAPAWTQNARPTSTWDALIGAIEKASDYALDPALYDLEEIRALRIQARPRGIWRRPALDAAAVADADIHLSYAFVRYASHLQNGIAAPDDVDPEWAKRRPAAELAELLSRAVSEGAVGRVLDELAPHEAGFRRLVEASARYRRIADAGGWPVVPPSAWSATGERADVLLKRLRAEGDLVEAGSGAGPEIAAALRHFQHRHGLADTGALDDVTRAALSVPAPVRAQQMDVTLDRWRWLPADLGARHVIVNIPAYELYLLDGETVELQMKVVVGEKDKPTPVFSDEMTHVVFSPSWNVPETIVTEEMLPRLEKEPAFLEERGIEVTRDGKVIRSDDIDPDEISKLKFQQKPGPDNALGLVKFVFPNHYAVYLHDTPAADAFRRSQRALSHGCVRIEKPVELAQHVLREDKTWTREQIEDAMQAGIEKAVRLKAALPVHIVYWTSWVDADGTVEFRDDVYGDDATQARVMARLRPTAPREVAHNEP